MKNLRRNRIYRKYGGALLATLVFIGFLTLVYIPDERPKFTVTKEICGSGGCETLEIANKIIWLDENTSFSRYDGRIEWLDENAQCMKITCAYHYNDSQRAKINVLNSSRTWNGPIEYTEGGSAIFYEQGVGIVQECQPCEEYIYKDYTIYRK